MKKSDVETAFKVRPFMDEGSLRNYLITERPRGGIPWNGTTTFQAVYMKTYNALCDKARER
jgi:hypothetical protein